MFRTTVSLSLCALSMGGSVSADGCWRTEEGSFMACHPLDPTGKEISGTGPKDDMKQRCIDMGEDCMGVTCSRDGKCSLRHPFRCNHDGSSIKPSPDGETTYVKQCELSKYNFNSYPDSDIICDSDSDVYRGDLIEGEIRCAALGHQCFGLTCNTSSEFPNGFECALKERRFCGDDKIIDVSTVVGVSKVSYVMKPKDTTTPTTFTGCDYTHHVSSKFGCGTPEQAILTLEEAKKECTEASTATNSCIGVLCGAGSTTDCRLHYVCPHFNQQNFVVDDPNFEVHIKTCSDGDICTSPCHEHIEASDHRCGTDCHCAGTRTCTNGYCSGNEQICLVGNCVFEEQLNKYLPCYADENHVGTSLAEAQQRCRDLDDRCTGVTCTKDGLCTTRFPALGCSHSESLEVSHLETSYIKCCGSRDLQQLYCPAVFKSSSSSHAGLYIFFIILLLIIVAGLFYKNRQMANNFIAPDAFKAVPHNDAEEGGDWIVNDNLEARDDDDDLQ